MNYLALLMCAYLATTMGLPLIDETEWQNYKLLHGKSYNATEDITRRAILAHNKHKIDQFNANKSFEMGLNKYSDRTEEEIQLMHGFRLAPGLKSTKIRDTPEAQKFLDNFLKGKQDFPSKVDWRKVRSRVSKVKDQGHCGSCWAFSTTGLLEGQEFRFRRNRTRLVSLSEQDLIDCDHYDYGCVGGIMDHAFNYIREAGGIDDENSYPYEARKNDCRYIRNRSVMTTNGAARLDSSEDHLQDFVARYGPVAAAIDASDMFRHYKGGILDDETCSNRADRLNHSILVVGYGTDKKYGDYWICKNSWGPSYGEHGYIRMARNRGNMCGIVTYAVISTS